jgi:hypothetical protein
MRHSLPREIAVVLAEPAPTCHHTNSRLSLDAIRIIHATVAGSGTAFPPGLRTGASSSATPEIIGVLAQAWHDRPG